MSQQVVMARALYDFTGDPAVRQLSFKKNDMIKVTHQYENGWWAGELNGKIGYLPSTYIKVEGSSASPAPASRGPAAPAKPAPSTTPAPTAKPTPPSVRPSPPPERQAFTTSQPVTTSSSGISTQAKPAPPATKPLPEPVKPAPPATKPLPEPVKPAPPAATKPLPPVKPAPSTPAPIQSKPAPPAKPAPVQGTLGRSGWASAATPGSEVNEADFNELDSLIKSLQDEVLDLKKLL